MKLSRIPYRVVWKETAIKKLGKTFGRKYAKNISVKVRQKLLKSITRMPDNHLIIDAVTNTFEVEMLNWLTGFGIMGTVSSELLDVVPGTRYSSAYTIKVHKVVFALRLDDNTITIE
jgi:hypothetical protein